MSQHRPDPLLHEIRKLGVAVCAEGQADAALLERFTDERDETAFTALVRRHGPMVLSVCRRVLRHEADAEDAWQATFLVLARRAASIRKRGSLGSWLHGTAYRIAAHLRQELARRHVREQPAAEVPETSASEVSWREVQEILDEELGRLPEKYRLPIVLCYLEGKTRDEAARELGWGVDTLRGRLERGRERLRGRLARRGVTLSAVLLASLIARDAIGGMIAPTLVATAARAALLTVAGQALTGVVSVRAIRLAEGVLRAMFATRITIAAVVVLALGFAGVGLLARQQGGDVRGGGTVTKNESQDPRLPGLPPGPPPPRRPIPDPRAAPPDESAPWSKPSDGIQGRLVLLGKEPVNGTPILNVYLELRNVTNNASPIEILPDAWQLDWTVTDVEGKEQRPESGPFDEVRGPLGTLRLPWDSTLRLNVTHRGAGIPKDQGAFLDLGVGRQWTFRRDDPKPYFLQARLSHREVKGNVWTGALDLPKVEVPLDATAALVTWNYDCEHIRAGDAVRLLAPVYRRQRGFLAQSRAGNLTIRARPSTLAACKQIVKELDRAGEAPDGPAILKRLLGENTDKDTAEEVQKAMERVLKDRK